jgi:hypothetical protein
MSSHHGPAIDTRARGATAAIQRLLFVSDAAVADAHRLASSAGCGTGGSRRRTLQ